jgi:hypothetical protein
MNSLPQAESGISNFSQINSTTQVGQVSYGVIATLIPVVHHDLQMSARSFE